MKHALAYLFFSLALIGAGFLIGYKSHGNGPNRSDRRREMGFLKKGRAYFKARPSISAISSLPDICLRAASACSLAFNSGGIENVTVTFRCSRSIAGLPAPSLAPPCFFRLFHNFDIFASKTSGEASLPIAA